MSNKNARSRIMIAVSMGRAIKLAKKCFFFNPTVKKEETRKFTSFYRGPYIIVEIINNLTFKVEDKKTRNEENYQGPL